MGNTIEELEKSNHGFKSANTRLSNENSRLKRELNDARGLHAEPPIDITPVDVINNSPEITEEEEEENMENKQTTTNWSWLPWILFALALLAVLLLWHPWNNTVVPPAAPAPVPVICTTPSIIASAVLDGKTLTTTGLFLDTNLGKRMTFTSRSLLVPEKAWNDPLTAEELKTVEETWQFMQVCIPDGLFGRIFAGGFEQGINRYENGVLITLQPGVYEFKLRNGEIVLWYPQQEEFASKDLERIVEQIKFGNFDIHSELAFFGVTADILPKLDQALVKERNVQLVVAPDPMVIK